MDTLKQMLDSYTANRKANSTTTQDSAQRILAEGFSLISEVLLELEATSCLNGSKLQPVDEIICSLKSYCEDNFLYKRPDFPYAIAHLSIEALKEIISNSRQQMDFDKNETSVMEADIKYRRQMKELMLAVDELRNRGKLSLSCFTGLYVDMEDIPMEVLYIAHTHKLVTFTAYIYHNKDRKKVLHELEDGLISLLTSLTHVEAVSKDNMFSAQLVAIELLTALLRMALSLEMESGYALPSQDCSLTCNAVLNGIICKTSKLLLSVQDSPNLCVPSGIHFTLLKQKIPLLSAAHLKEYIAISLCNLITQEPHIDLNQAVNQQLSWLSGRTSSKIEVFTENLLKALSTNDVMDVIQKVLEIKSLNWQLALMVVSVYIRCIPSAPESLKGFIDWLLMKALTARDSTKLTIAFLLARQSCAETKDQHVFPSYTNWFGTTFGSEARRPLTASSRSAFEFLLQVLTNLVPLEAPLYLRVHINKIPQAPPTCVALLGDYIVLARTQLKDLGESTSGGLFSFEHTPKEDVIQALAHFERTGQLSRIVLDATVFRRQEYEEDFLPCLLTPCLLPDKYDVQSQFVRKLYTAGKVPHSAYEKFEMECKELTGLSVGGNSEELGKENILSPLEAWKCGLISLGIAIKSSIEDKYDWTKPPAIVDKRRSATATVLKDVMKRCRDCQPSEMENLHEMAVKQFLEAFIQCFQSCGIMAKVQWPGIFLSLLQPFPKLIQILNVGLQEIGCQKSPLGDVAEATAVLAYTMESQGLILPSTSNMTSLADSVSQKLHMTQKEEMLYCYRFCAQFLQQISFESIQSGRTSVKYKSQPDFRGTLKKYVYLRERLAHSDDAAVVEVLSKSWFPKDQSTWSVQLRGAQMNVKEWLALERKVDHTQDILSNRQMYFFHWMVNNYSSSKYEAASELLSACLQYSDTGKDGEMFCQDLLSVVPLIVYHCGEEPWLPSAWETLSQAYRHDNIFRMVSSLPSWLLLSNRLGASVPDKSLENLAQFISKCLKDNLTDMGFLSCPLMWYILTALVTSYSDSTPRALSQLVELCPAVHGSLLAHAQQLHPVLLMKFSNTPTSDEDNVGRIVKLIDVLLQVVKADSFANHSDLLEEIIAQNHPWEAGLFFWKASFWYKLTVLGEPVSDPFRDWVLFFRVMQFGDLLISGKVRADFVGNDCRITILSKIPSECSFPFLAEELLAERKVLRIMSSFFEGYPSSLTDALSKCSHTSLAIGLAVLLLALPLERLQHMDEMLQIVEILSSCYKVWVEAVNTTAVWCRLSARHQYGEATQEHYLLTPAFMKRISDNIVLRNKCCPQKLT